MENKSENEIAKVKREAARPLSFWPRAFAVARPTSLSWVAGRRLCAQGRGREGKSRKAEREREPNNFRAAPRSFSLSLQKWEHHNKVVVCVCGVGE